jgi:hypothetical protein
LVNVLLRLRLGAEEQHRLPCRCDLARRFARGLDALERLLQVDDVNPILLHKNIGLHFWIPPLGLVAKMNPCFQQIFQGEVTHNEPPLVEPPLLRRPTPTHSGHRGAIAVVQCV